MNSSRNTDLKGRWRRARRLPKVPARYELLHRKASRGNPVRGYWLGLAGNSKSLQREVVSLFDSISAIEIKKKKKREKKRKLISLDNDSHLADEIINRLNSAATTWSV